jgi:hypothetical protein
VRKKPVLRRKSMDLTLQFLQANIHGAARRQYLALLFGNRLATHADGFSSAAAVYCQNPGARVLDYVIPLSGKHLRTILREWVTHYNQERPHASLVSPRTVRSTGRKRGIREAAGEAPRRDRNQ